MAEWLGTALQKLLQRFESASDLQQKTPSSRSGFFHPSIQLIASNSGLRYVERASEASHNQRQQTRSLNHSIGKQRFL